MTEPTKKQEHPPFDIRRVENAYVPESNLPLFVLDIESVPDTSLIKKLVLPIMKWEHVPEEVRNDFKSKAEKPDEMSKEDLVQLAQWHYGKLNINGVIEPRDFLHLMFHQVLCVGYLIRPGNGEIHKGVMHGKNEREVIEKFSNFFNRCKPYPRLVTFNGKSFDVPVLALRMMKYGIKCPVLWEGGENGKDFRFNRTYFNRYNHSKHMDLSEHAVHFAYNAKPSLNLTAAFLDIPTKSDNMCGGDVMAYHYAGRDKEIFDYCLQDVIVTYRFYLKYLFTSSFITKEEYDARIAAI